MRTGERSGPGPICRVLRDHNVLIAPSTFFAARNRPPSARQQCDGRLLGSIKRVFYENFAVYGVRKMWQALLADGFSVGRDQVARLMCPAGLRGSIRRRKMRTTFPGPVAARSPDLVKREWVRDPPDLVWVSDFTHISTREGTVYKAFLHDGFSRRILGFRVATSKSAELVTRPLDQAISVRRRSDPFFVSEGVIVHSDAGSQFTSLAFSQKLLDHGINGSIGRVGTAYDNALMERTIGLYKAELIHAGRRRSTSRQEVETATTAWVRWFSERRLHSALGYQSTAQFEAAYTQILALPRQAA